MFRLRVLGGFALDDGSGGPAPALPKGRREALREVRWLERFEAVHQDRHDSGPPYWRARILARLGETDEALDEIERLLAGPSLFSMHELRISPDFDSLRDHPRYQALLPHRRAETLTTIRQGQVPDEQEDPDAGR